MAPHTLLCTDCLINIHLVNNCISLLLKTEYISPGKMETNLQSARRKYNPLKPIPKTHFTERKSILTLAELVPKHG